MLTAEQLAKRKLGIGGSDAAAVAGICPWKTPLEVYIEKTSPLLTELDMLPIEKFYWGNAWEPEILKAYDRLTGEKTLTLNEDTKQFFKENHDVYTWMRANVDGLLLNKHIIIECKTASYDFSNKWGVPGTDEMPENYLLQCAHYAIVYDAIRVDLAVLFGINDFRIYHYHRNEKLEERLIEIERNFWHEHVLKQIPPEPITLHDNILLWPQSLPKTKIATNETFMEVYQLNSLRKRIDELQENADKLKLKIQAEMGDHDTLIGINGEKLTTWKTQISRRTDNALLKRDYPNICAQYVREIENRVFRMAKLDT